MSPAVNYACTGHFGPIRLAPNPSLTEQAGLHEMHEFLYVRRLSYSCASFPRVLPTSFFDDIDASNLEQPLYITLSYGVIWRWFGVHWAATYYVVGFTVALSFLITYFCARRFMPPIFAASLILWFLSSPFFIIQILSPRDLLKFPFVIAITGLLIGAGTSLRTPGRFIAFACAAGALIGVGYGFRSDLYLLFLFPAALIICVLGQLHLSGLRLARTRQLFTQLSIRALAGAALLLSFGVGGWMPLLNDGYIHRSSGNSGYHVMAMGLYGQTNASLYQSNAPHEEIYMFRNNYTNDLAAGVRIIEYARRRDGIDIPFARDIYWDYSKKYYLDAISYVPADLLARGIGAFVNLMTLPASAANHPPMVGDFSPAAPWTRAYDFTRGTAIYDRLAVPLDHLYQAASTWRLTYLLPANLIILFLFLYLLAQKFGIRSPLAALILLGTVMMVTAQRFEVRYMFYVYAFILVVWGSVAWSTLRGVKSLLAAMLDHARGGSSAAAVLIGRLRAIAPVLGRVAAMVVLVCAAAFAALEATRAYQVTALRPLLAEWGARQRVPAHYEVTEIPPGPLDVRTMPPGMSRIRILSPMPLSTGGMRLVDAWVTKQVEMGVVAIELDGLTCRGRKASITGIGDSSPFAISMGTGLLLNETFVVFFRDKTNYVIFLPAFCYAPAVGVAMHFGGIEIETSNVSCIKSVSFISEFKKGDALFDFIIPEDTSRLKRDDLFQRVYFPGLGFL